MSIVKPSVLKEIAKEIAIGNTCYIHRNTKKITTIDNTVEDAELIVTQDQVQAELEKKIDEFVKIEKLNMENLLVIMKDFLEELPDKSLRKQLSNALNRSNPARNFSKTVENNLELNAHWANFKIEEHQRWVSNFIIDAYNY